MSILAKQMVDFRLIIRTALDPHSSAGEIEHGAVHIACMTR
jgi:hypothetical protein